MVYKVFLRWWSQFVFDQRGEKSQLANARINLVLATSRQNSSKVARNPEFFTVIPLKKYLYFGTISTFFNVHTSCNSCALHRNEHHLWVSIAMGNLVTLSSRVQRINEGRKVFTLNICKHESIKLKVLLSPEGMFKPRSSWENQDPICMLSKLKWSLSRFTRIRYANFDFKGRRFSVSWESQCSSVSELEHHWLECSSFPLDAWSFGPSFDAWKAVRTWCESSTLSRSRDAKEWGRFEARILFLFDNHFEVPHSLLNPRFVIGFGTKKTDYCVHLWHQKKSWPLVDQVWTVMFT